MIKGPLPSLSTRDFDDIAPFGKAHQTGFKTMDVLPFGNRLSAPPVQDLAWAPWGWTSRPVEVSSAVDQAHGLIGLPGSSPRRATSPPHRAQSRRRPLTFHEGYPSSISTDVDEVYGKDSLASTEERLYQHNGPTIGSIRCFDDPSLPPQVDHDSTHTSTPSTPTLRLDTSCARTPPTTRSPLAMVSNFLGTLAGLVQSPGSTPVHRKPDNRASTIMIFDSDVLMELAPDESFNDFGKPGRSTTSEWVSTSIEPDWSHSQDLLQISTSYGQMHPTRQPIETVE